MNDVFYEIFDELPRVGPGNNESTRKAFKCLNPGSRLPRHSKLLDIGCGTGNHTLQLAKLFDGNITALDSHQAFMDKLQNRLEKEGVADKIDCVIGDMGAMNFEEESFNVIWAEGSIFILGLEKGLKEWRKFLAPGGLIALSDLFWFKPSPPEELKALWDQQCPWMVDLEGARKIVERSGYNLIDHFQVPENAWWDEYNNPLEKQLKVSRDKHRNNSEALGVIESLQTEIDMYRKYSDYYGYLFLMLEKRE